MKRIIPLLSVTTVLALSHSAVYAGKHDIYVGGGFGYSSLDTPSDSVYIVGTSNGSTTITQTNSESDTGGLGGTLFAGIMLNKNFAIEADYVKYAESEYKSTQEEYQDLSLNGSNTSTLDYKTHSYGLFLKAIIPISERLDAYGKIGADYVDQEVNYSAPIGIPTVSIDTSKVAQPKEGNNSYSEILPAGGLGFSYHINDKFSLSLFFEGFIGNGDIETDQDAIASAYITGMTLSYHFS